MDNPYQTPQSTVLDADLANNSGGGSSIEVPDGVKGWSWGAFLLNWIWAIFNKTWIGLLAIIPYIGLIFAIYLGVKGRELAWKSKRWDSLEHFNRVQRTWSKWSLIVVIIPVIGILAAVALPAYHDYVTRTHSAATQQK